MVSEAMHCNPSFGLSEFNPRKDREGQIDDWSIGREQGVIEF